MAKKTATPSRAKAEVATAEVKETVKPENAKTEKAKAEAPVHPHADTQGRIPHPALNVDAEGIPQNLLEKAPEDFHHRKHRPLTKRDFKSEDLYYDYQYELYTKRAEESKAKAEEIRAMGSTNDRTKAKKLMTLAKKMEELRRQLSAQGVNVDELLAMGLGDDTAESGENATTSENTEAKS